LGKAVPYGVYDITANAGCVSVGIDNDTAQFSVNSIRRWLDVMGRDRNPEMEQDRAPAVLPHHPDLARQAPDQPRNRGRTDCLDHDPDRSDGALRTGYTELPEGHQGQRRRDENPQYQGQPIPSGVELYHIAETASLKR